MGCHVPGWNWPLSSTQRAWRRRVHDCEKSVVLFVWKFCKEEWVNFTSSEWYDLLWKNKQIQGIIRQEKVRRTSISPASFSAHKSTLGRFGLDSICCCFVCIEWWIGGKYCKFGVVVVVVVTMKWRIYLLWERMKETCDVTYQEWVSRAELGQAELLEFGVADLLLFRLDRKVVL